MPGAASNEISISKRCAWVHRQDLRFERRVPPLAGSGVFTIWIPRRRSAWRTVEALAQIAWAQRGYPYQPNATGSGAWRKRPDHVDRESSWRSRQFRQRYVHQCHLEHEDDDVMRPSVVMRAVRSAFLLDTRRQARSLRWERRSAVSSTVEPCHASDRYYLMARAILSEFGAHIRSAAEGGTQMASPTSMVGIFHAPVQAREAIEALRATGFEPDEISVLSPDPRPTHSDQDAGTRAERLTAESATVRAADAARAASPRSGRHRG
jgi:hypothetical protein